MGDGMRQVRYEFVLEAATAIAHAEAVFGNASVVMTRKLRGPDGAFVRVPIVTADTLRHRLREAGTYALLDAAGLLAGAGPQLSAAALRLLFNGGMLTGRGDAGAVKLDEWRALMDALPTLRLLGGCANNAMIPGQVSVGDALLICAETRHLVPPWTLAYAAGRGPVETYRAHVDEEQRVRMDATREPGKQRLLAPGARDAVARRLAASERAHDADDAAAREATKSAMLPRTCEVLVPGSLFAWDLTATVYDDLDHDTLVVMTAAFLANAVVGGKGGTGHGRVRALAANRVELARPREAAESLDVTALAPRLGEVFRAHVATHAAALRAALAAVDA